MAFDNYEDTLTSFRSFSKSSSSAPMMLMAGFELRAPNTPRWEEENKTIRTSSREYNVLSLSDVMDSRCAKRNTKAQTDRQT
jgi:uncharacterized protein YajQ (UPF0234 family)